MRERGRRKLRERVDWERGGESGKESLECGGACWWDQCVRGEGEGRNKQARESQLLKKQSSNKEGIIVKEAIRDGRYLLFIREKYSLIDNEGEMDKLHNKYLKLFIVFELQEVIQDAGSGAFGYGDSSSEVSLSCCGFSGFIGC